MDPAVLLALQSLTVPEWFPPACEQPISPGYALVAVQDSPRADTARGEFVLWIEPDGGVWVREQELSGWLREPLAGATRERDGARWYLLADNPLPYRFDPCTLTLWIAPSRDTLQLDLGAAPLGRLLPAQPGGFLNLDLFAADAEGAPAEYAGLADLGLASGFAALRSAWSTDDGRIRRLDSYFTLDDPEHLHRLRVGDGVTRVDGLGTAVRYGGVRWGTDFALQPEVPRFALPGVSGEAALPSIVELYVDDQLRDRREVDPGPFAIRNPPILTGDGNLQLVVRDALGRETLYQQPFYVSSQSLAAGVADYAIELGRLRENFGADDDHYDDAFALGNYRYGYSDRLTAGARLELQSAARTLGGSALYLWPGIGQFNGALAASDGDAGSGAQLALGFERVARGMSLGLQGSWSDPEYVELGRAPGAVARALRATAGFALGRGRGLTLGWNEELRRDRENLELSALTYSQPLLGGYASVAWLHSPQAGDSSLLSYSRALAGGHTVSLQLQSNGDGDLLLTLSWQRSAPDPLGWHSLAAVSGGARDAALASLAYSAPRGTARLSAAQTEGQRTTQAELNTGLAWLGRDLYWTRPVRESFAVVDASAPGVRIYRDNQRVGVTGTNGRALVPDVITYNTTRLSLDTQDLPLDRRLSDASQQVKIPPGGALVTLALTAQPLLQFRLLLDSGMPVPAGAQLSLDGQPQDLPVGLDGLVYLQAPAQPYVLRARWSQGECETERRAPETPTAEVICRRLP